VFKVVFGIDIVVSQPQGSDNDEMEDQEDFPGLEGTHSNPISSMKIPFLLLKLKRGLLSI
jgi:hypothetical protein